MSVKVREFLEQPHFGYFVKAFTSETCCDMGSKLELRGPCVIFKIQWRKFSFYDCRKYIYIYMQICIFVDILSYIYIMKRV